MLWQQIKYRGTYLSLQTQSAEKQNKVRHETKEVSWEHASVFAKPSAEFFHQTYSHQGNVGISHITGKKTLKKYFKIMHLFSKHNLASKVQQNSKGFGKIIAVWVKYLLYVFCNFSEKVTAIVSHIFWHIYMTSLLLWKLPCMSNCRKSLQFLIKDATELLGGIHLLCASKIHSHISFWKGH